MHCLKRQSLIQSHMTTELWIRSEAENSAMQVGSSSVLVQIGSHSLCKFPFFHTKWRKFPLLYTQEAMRAIWWKKNVLFIFY